ncbi:MAG TPA: G5 domain-containing protein [Candidatus Saccharimonadales bacterium]|nr:G5 domain-containing protein [Candidatus Saccharimonadales bacterium]
MRNKIHRFHRKVNRAGRKKFRQLKLVSRHPVAVPVVTFLLLGGLTALLYFSFVRHDLPKTDAMVVIVSHDHQEQVIPSRKQTVGALIKKLGIKLNQGDVVEPALNTSINQDNFRINIYRAVPVEIIDGNQHTFTFSAAATPRSIVAQAAVSVYPEDNININPVTNFIAQEAIGEQVVIDRATPVNVDLYGTPVVLRTHAKTIAELVKEKHIHLSKNDQIVPDPSTPISAAVHVAFIRTGTKVQTVTEDIATPIQYVNDVNLAYGTSAIRQAGSPGQQVVTYQIELKNNVETRRVVIQKVVTKTPVTQIVARGINLGGIKGDMALAGIDPSDYDNVDYIFTRESHWNPSAVNSSGCAGLGQACPGSKLASACPNWQNDPVCQIRFFNGYAVGRYGSWSGARAFWASHGYW